MSKYRTALLALLAAAMGVMIIVTEWNAHHQTFDVAAIPAQPMPQPIPKAPVPGPVPTFIPNYNGPAPPQATPMRP